MADVVIELVLLKVHYPEFIKTTCLHGRSVVGTENRPGNREDIIIKKKINRVNKSSPITETA